MKLRRAMALTAATAVNASAAVLVARAAKPAGNPTGLVPGSLAETGSASAVPVFAAAGGAAAVLGAGAMFIVRRRRSGDTGA
ncbi:LAETG motif-containing sortase-dependent surface protein [Streptomyces sp. BE133]|uniref:LAETG motif-containing sortase-dependent surface protein n=1 Tax=Streptomyces sp. BE133 TaxID=3002523 RepID=UPI002E7705A3|nr:LAETG motif-containing sortase-dependent surface protein [Streptomyces sp. BE133]